MYEPQYFILFLSVLYFISSFWVSKVSARFFLLFKKTWPLSKLRAAILFFGYLTILVVDIFINYNAIYAFLIFISYFKTGLEDYYEGAAFVLAFVYTILFFGWNMETIYRKNQEG